MRFHRSILFATTLVCAAAVPARAELKLPRVSQNASVSQTIGTTELAIRYSRPGVKGRTIWGALVPWGKPWRTGANELTSFTTSDAITVEGQPLPAGTYGVVTIPGTEQWTVAFSKQKELWGAFAYDSTQDQLRVVVKPHSSEPTEWMQFTFDVTSPDACELALRWEKLRVAARIGVDVRAQVMRDARAAVAAAEPGDWKTLHRAASYANDNDLAPADAAAWASSALKVKENFATLSLSAKLTQKAGHTRDATAQLTRAIALGKADKEVSAEQIAPMEKLLGEWAAKK